MLADSSTQNDHACFRCLHAHIVNLANIGYNIDDKRGGRLVRVKEEHITKRSIRQRWAEDRNIVLSLRVSRRYNLTQDVCVLSTPNTGQILRC